MMWRDDGAYDLVVPLGYNDAPPEPGRGSAIFALHRFGKSLHCWLCGSGACRFISLIAAFGY